MVPLACPRDVPWLLCRRSEGTGAVGSYKRVKGRIHNAEKRSTGGPHSVASPLHYFVTTTGGRWVSLIHLAWFSGSAHGHSVSCMLPAFAPFVCMYVLHGESSKRLVAPNARCPLFLYVCICV